MKKFLYTLACMVLLLAFFTACQQDTAESASQPSPHFSDNQDGAPKLRVITTIFPPYDFVREIAGDTVELTMLLSPGAESHSFEPTPQDIIAIQNCDILIYTGGDSDSWIDRMLESVDISEITLLTLMEMVEVVEEELVDGMEEGHFNDDGGHSHDEAVYDEHVWTSPKNAAVLVQGISGALCSLDPDNKALYQENTRLYQEQLSQLDLAFQEVVDSAARKTLLFGDRFPFRYLVDAYGLTYYAAFPGCSTETEASAGTVAFLIDKAVDEEIPVVFFIELSNEKMADTITESTGAQKRLLHSCHNLAKSDFERGATYLNLMTQNVLNLKEALS